MNDGTLSTILKNQLKVHEAHKLQAVRLYTLMEELASLHHKVDELRNQLLVQEQSHDPDEHNNPDPAGQGASS